MGRGEASSHWMAVAVKRKVSINCIKSVVKHSKYTYKNFISEVQDLGSWLVTLKFPSDISEMKSVFQMTGNLYTVELYGFRAKNSKR